ncbi:MAG: Uma2 family endonuclease [Hormoscilla sp. GM7CHS1pb]|nr:Uma2 family endonuclease [Hormoscilla sp. GM7CHS1pb]
MVESGLPSPTVPTEPSVDIALTGWRYEEQVQPDGTTENIMVPLTPMEFLHPEEDYHFPNSTFHQDVICDARIMLENRYWEDPTVAVFSDLLIEWDMPYPPRHCPDLFVVFGIRNKEQFRSTFVVRDEAVRPVFVLEVVSPGYRKEDKQTKLLQYEQAGISEYVIIDRRTRRGQAIYEVLGYRLVTGRYLPMIADDDGRIPCETIGLWVSMQDGRLVLEDMETGERLLKSTEWKARSQELSAENQELKAKFQGLSARLRELEAQQQGRRSSSG